jgi:hypothetical protein
MTEPSSGFAVHLLAELNCAKLRAELLVNDSMAISVVLKAKFIDVDSTIEHLHERGALGLIAISSAIS